MELVVGFSPVTTPVSKFGEKFGEVLVKMLFGSSASGGAAASLRVTTALLRQGSAVNPMYTEGAFRAAYQSIASIPKVTGGAADRLVELLYKGTTDKIASKYSDLRDLYQRYKVSVLPATLRYSQKMEEWKPWEAEQNAKVEAIRREQQAQAASAAESNRKRNAVEGQKAQAREREIKQAVSEALQNPLPAANAPGGQGAQPIGPGSVGGGTGTGVGGGAGSPSGNGCTKGVRPDGSVVLCTIVPYPDPSRVNKVPIPRQE
jgi:hypothetical protein